MRAPGAEEIATITAELFVDTVPVSGSDEIDPSVPTDVLAGHRVAKKFDSTEAVKRLAAGKAAVNHATAPEMSFIDRAATDLGTLHAKGEPTSDPGAAQVIRANPWSKRDRKLFICAVMGAIALGMVIALV